MAEARDKRKTAGAGIDFARKLAAYAFATKGAVSFSHWSQPLASQISC